MSTLVVSVDNKVADKIAHDMARLPEELRKSIRPKLREAATAVVRDAKVRSSWSGRIPNTIRAQTSFRLDREGVIVIAGGKNTPHARLYESVGGHAYFRHPVYAKGTNRAKWRWVAQATRPYFFVAARAHQAETDEAMLAALAKAASAIGFGG